MRTVKSGLVWRPGLCSLTLLALTLLKGKLGWVRVIQTEHVWTWVPGPSLSFLLLRESG